MTPLIWLFFPVLTICLPVSPLSPLLWFSLTGSDSGSAVRQVLPDVGVLVISLVTWRLIMRLNSDTHTQVEHTHTHECNLVKCAPLVA